MTQLDDGQRKEIRGQQDKAHHALLTIHKGLIDHALLEYETRNARKLTPNEALNLLIRDPGFGWLKPLSGMITGIDELTSSRTPFSLEDGREMLKKARELVTPDENGEGFQKAYWEAIQKWGGVAEMHGKWKQF